MDCIQPLPKSDECPHSPDLLIFCKMCIGTNSLDSYSSKFPLCSTVLGINKMPGAWLVSVFPATYRIEGLSILSEICRKLC